MKHIAALVSGGVDSSVALCLFLEKNPKYSAFVHIYYLKIWLEDELSFLGSCPWEEDLSYVKQLAQKLDLPLHVISLQREYHDSVLAYTLEELKKGATPSPDIFCNSLIKFGVFLEKIDYTDIIITGHYGQTTKDSDGQVHLFCAKDSLKDQSYFLSQLNQAQLSKLYMPVGQMQKTEVRKYAAEHKLANQDRKDSQGLCFLGKIRYKDFIKYHLGSKKGAILDEDSQKVLGYHEGSWFYTIGQRTGLGLGSGPWYVTNKSHNENIVWVSHANSLSKKNAKIFHHEVPHWIGSCEHTEQTEQTEQGAESTLQVKLRHGPELLAALCSWNKEGGTVTLTKNDYGIAEGQYVVFYKEQASNVFSQSSPDHALSIDEGLVYECLGSARICRPSEKRS